MVYVTAGLRVKQRNRKLIKEHMHDQEKMLADSRKPYKASQWCRDMVNTVKHQSDSNGKHNAGGAFLDQLHRKYKAKVNEHAKADLRKMGHDV